eukprot:scaffold5311_cov120-Isochrysis_galbana.AAC.3
MRRGPTLEGVRITQRRAEQRWSALVSAPPSRLARQMRPFLGEELWEQFVVHDVSNYKRVFVRAFSPSTNVLRCVGTVEGRPCSPKFQVDLREAAFVRSHIGFLHLDHEVEVDKTFFTRLAAGGVRTYRLTLWAGTGTTVWMARLFATHSSTSDLRTGESRVRPAFVSAVFRSVRAWVAGCRSRSARTADRCAGKHPDPNAKPGPAETGGHPTGAGAGESGRSDRFGGARGGRDQWSPL